MSFTFDHLAGRPELVRRVFELANVVFEKRVGADWIVTCPFHPDESPSLRINLEKALYHCDPCGAGGDAVEFYADRTGVTVDAAIRQLRDKLDLGTNSDQPHPIKTWAIRNEHGELVATHRLLGRDASGKKIFPWDRKGIKTAELPLYGSERLREVASGTPIVVAEGEKAADAILEHGLAGVGTVTGASETPGPAALEVLRGRDVVLWPDHDQPGRGHMERVAAALSGIAASVRLLSWGEQKGDDAYDFFARGGSLEQLDRMLADAPCWSPAIASGENPAESAPLLSVSLLDLDADPPAPPSFIIEGLIPEHELVLLFGKPFGGKSLLSLQMGLHGAAGVDFLPMVGGVPSEFRISRPLRVLYVDEEMGLPLLWKRIRLMRAGRREFDEPEVLRRFRVTSRKGLRLDDEAKLALLRRELAQFPGGPPDVVFLDTLRRMHRAEEKNSEMMAAVMGAPIALGEEFGTATVAIHHSKKGPLEDDDDWREAARGSGDLVAASQAVIGMLKTDDVLFTARADVKAAGEIKPFPLLLDGQTFIFRRQSDHERAAAKDDRHNVALAEAKARLCKSLMKLRDAGSRRYPASWTAWREKAEGNASTLAEAREALLKPEADESGQRPAVVVKIKRSGRGGGEAYLFAEDFAEQLGLGSETRSETRSEMRLS